MIYDYSKLFKNTESAQLWILPTYIARSSAAEVVFMLMMWVRESEAMSLRPVAMATLGPLGMLNSIVLYPCSVWDISSKMQIELLPLATKKVKKLNRIHWAGGWQVTPVAVTQKKTWGGSISPWSYERASRIMRSLVTPWLFGFTRIFRFLWGFFPTYSNFFHSTNSLRGLKQACYNKHWTSRKKDRTARPKSKLITVNI